MAYTACSVPQVTATVTEVLPGLGLVYLDGDDQRSWTVTKSTRGTGLQALQPGKRVRLILSQHPDFTLVSEYIPVD